MRTSRILMHLGTSLFISQANGAYVPEDVYNTTNFFNEFSFFSSDDPTHGYVSYTSAIAANASGLAGYSYTGVYLGVDHTTTNPNGGRASTRVSSNKAYNQGLFIADIAHMPGSICGVWPSFWSFGSNWPNKGEIDIIEGVNNAVTNSMTLHTSSGCTMTSSQSMSNGGNCNAGNGNDGCGIQSNSSLGYGDGFNKIGGGVYAMEWTSNSIKIWNFPRGQIPADITAGSPDPTKWSTPAASFASASGSGCDIGTHFQSHNLVFDTTFCGDWASNVWSSNAVCSILASTCNAYVGANPEAFVEAYWVINSVKVYQQATTVAGKREERLFKA